MKNIEGIEIITAEALPEKVELVGQPRALPLSEEKITKLRQISELVSMLENTETIEQDYKKRM